MRMEWLESLINNNFDISFVILIILGNFWILNLDFYPQAIKDFKNSKTFLTGFHSLLLGFLYWWILSFTGTTGDPRVLLNSFLLSTSLYEFGMKSALLYIKEHGGTFLLDALKNKMENKDGSQK